MRTVRPLVAILATTLVAATAVAQQVKFNLTGTWSLQVVTENGTGTPTMVIRQTGDSLQGTYESARMGSLALVGTIKDSTFTLTMNTGGGAALTFKGVVVNADNIKGDLDFGGMGGATFTGTRKKD